MPLALRAWLRYVVPLTLLSVVACVPLAYVAWRVGIPKDLAKARAGVRLGWVLGAGAFACQLWLVAAVAPAIRGLASGTPLSQVAVLARGLRGLAHGLVPALVAVIAVALGGVALVIPGALLLVLLAMTGASERLSDPPPAPLFDSITIARANLARVAAVVGAIVAVNLAATLVLQWQLVPSLTRKLAPGKLADVRTFVRAVPLALALVSPLAACALASAYVRLTRRAS